MSEGTPLKVHVTGAYGLIGNLTYRYLNMKDQYDVYGSGRRKASSDRIDEEDLWQISDDRFFIADLANQEDMLHALNGMDVVVHLGAVPDPDASFEAVLNLSLIHISEPTRPY